MNIIINGMPYIKLNPTIYYDYKIENPINIQTGEEVIANKSKDLQNLPKFMLEQLEQNGLIKRIQKEQEDNIGFYQILSYENSTCFYNASLNTVFEYSTLDASTKDFISLNDFLNHAVYIGRKLNGSSPIRVLYEYQDLWLICSNNSDNFTVINKHNSLLNNYQIGDILPEYYSKNEVIKSIISELINPKNNHFRN